MPISIQWYNAKETILLETFTGAWNLNDYMQLIDDAALLLAQKDHLVHIICDFSATVMVPQHVLTGARYAEQKLPHNQGVVVFIKPGSFIGIFIKLTRQMGFKATTQLHIAGSLAEAVAIIHEKAKSFPSQTQS